MPDKEYDIPPMVNALVESAKKRGPMVLEVWDCPKCKMENFEFHHFEETVACSGCGRRKASCVPLYKSFMEKAADER